ncbi:MAG: L-threonylcarbamoyladenylate synthase [Bryobacteraceae bacterium]
MDPSETELTLAAKLIRAGRLVAFPTETVYGLGANALDEAAVQRIYDAKGRPATSPLIVHVADVIMARQVTAEWPSMAQRLAERFWPGPLTLVLPKADQIPDIVTAGLDTVGVRIPSHPVALALIRRAGVPIAAPSANRFTQISPTTAEHVRVGLGSAVDLILDGGATHIGIESTVVSLAEEHPTILRLGMISQADLEAATGVAWRVQHSGQVQQAVSEGALPGFAAPGMQSRHYAPRTPLVLLKKGQRKPKGRGRILEMPSEPAAYAARLYAALHEADTEGWDWIALREPPVADEWAGIRDRLKRAATELFEK